MPVLRPAAKFPQARFKMSDEFDLSDLKRRMQGSIASLKHELGGLRTGRASASLIEPVHVDVYGQSMPINQVATISVPESRMLSVQVWDKGVVGAVERAIRDFESRLVAGDRRSDAADPDPGTQ